MLPFWWIKMYILTKICF